MHRMRAGLALLPLAILAASTAAETGDAGVRASFQPAGIPAAVTRWFTATPQRRLIAWTGAGLCLVCLAAIPLGAAVRRRRERARRRQRIAALREARAPEVLGAALVARPLRKQVARTQAPSRYTTYEVLPPRESVSPEVAARAAALRAASVREAALRASALRAASQRSEERRSGAALRAQARRRPAATEPRVEAVAARPAPPPAPLRALPARAGAARDGSPTAPRDTTPRESAAPAAHAAGRVAILRDGGPLTLEWLECCLARDARDTQARLDLCTALLVAERFADVARVAHEGLALEPGDGRLQLRLSEALCGLERYDEALEAAVRAVRLHRTRKAVLHLTRLAALSRRFSAGDGARLRRALQGRPHEPVLLHALGVYESLHGSPQRALETLRLALRTERNPRWRRSVSREIARLRAAELAAAQLAPRRAAV